MKVASYCRVSTEKDDQTNSFEAQQRYFREYIQRNPGWELHQIYADEGISGTSTKRRAQFLRMINDAYEGKFDLIVTKEVSRFSRNIVDTITFTRDLKAIGVGVIFLNDGINTLDPDAELRLSIMASIAQEESRKTSSRVVWGQTRQMERGVVFGQSMLGYDAKDGALTVNPEGAELVRLIFEKYALEQVSTAQIARFLMDRGYRTYRGSNQWTTSKLVKILKNEKYVGDLVQKKSYTPDYLTHEKRHNAGQVPLIRIENHHEAIVSREIWEMTQERLKQNDKHSKNTAGHSNRYVFSGKIKCGVCGSSFACRVKKLKDGSRVRRWYCRKAETEGKAACSVGRILRDDDAIHMLQTALRNLHVDKKVLARDVTALVMSAVMSAVDHSGAGTEHLKREIEHIQRKKEKLLDSFLDGVLSMDEMRTMKSKYNEQQASLRERIDSIADPPKDHQQFRAAVQEEIVQLLNGEKGNDVFYKHLVDRLTVYKDRRLELRLKHIKQIFWFQ